jgi:ubiquinone/menaquinone biosynthesis C-methylase UbiE
MAEYEDIEISGRDTAEPLNLARRVAWLRRYLPLEDRRILDCGCGAGDYVLRLLELTPHVYGIEYEAAKVDDYRSRGVHPDRVVQGDIQDMPYDDASFDIVLLNEVLEHVPDEMAGLREIRRVMAPGGKLAIFSPNRLYPFETHGVTRLSTGRALPHYTPFIPYLPLWLGNRWFRYHARNYLPSELSRLLERAGFTIEHRGWMGQTFEGISRNQPGIMRRASPVLRRLSFAFERIPLINRFSAVSQFVVAGKLDGVLEQV